MTPLAIVQLRKANQRNRRGGCVGAAPDKIKRLRIGAERSAGFVEGGRNHSGREQLRLLRDGCECGADESDAAETAEQEST